MRWQKIEVQKLSGTSPNTARRKRSKKSKMAAAKPEMHVSRAGRHDRIEIQKAPIPCFRGWPINSMAL